MVTSTSWPEFMTHSIKLLTERPDRTRCTIKYRPHDKEYTFKVTDDYSTHKFKTDQSSDLRSIREFQQVMIQLMATGELDEAMVEKIKKEATEPDVAASSAKSNRQSGKQQQQQPQQQQQAAQAGGQSNKKQSGKKR